MGGGGPVVPHPFVRDPGDAPAPTVSPEELLARLAGGSPPLLVDVRPPGERRRARLRPDRPIPLTELLGRARELAGKGPVVLYDHYGDLAPRAAGALRAQAGLDASALEGGLEAYAQRADPSVGRYGREDDPIVLLQLPRPETGCLAYLIADERSGRAALIDPGIDVAPYLARLDAEGWRLDAIIESHTHADHLAGHAELHRRTGAPIYVSRRSPAAYAHRSLADGEEVMVGTVPIVALETPGHTQDHLTLRVGDRIFTGDTLLLGSCGRTDLGGGDPHLLYRSLHDVLLKLPPATEVFPAHFGPKHALPARYLSTLALEAATNEALRLPTEAEFLTYMTEGWPPKPANFDRIVAANLADVPAGG